MINPAFAAVLEKRGYINQGGVTLAPGDLGAELKNLVHSSRLVLANVFPDEQVEVKTAYPAQFGRLCELLIGQSSTRAPQVSQGESVSPAGKDALYSWSGRGVTSTRPFKVSDRWELQWNTDGDFFAVYLKSAEGELLDVLANQVGKGSGSAFYPKGGEYYLQINAMGNWKVRVVNVP